MKTLRPSNIAAYFSACLFALLSPQILAADGQVVIEDLTPSQLRREIKKIETEFYRVYNNSVAEENKQLAIVCYDYLPTGSNIKKEACEPQFVIDKRADNANDSNLGFDIGQTPKGLQAELAAEYAALTAAMTKLAGESDYFRELDGILGALRAELENR